MIRNRSRIRGRKRMSHLTPALPTKYCGGEGETISALVAKLSSGEKLRRSTDDRINMRLLFETGPVRQIGTTNPT
jgi:hypothetical protein